MQFQNKQRHQMLFFRTRTPKTKFYEVEFLEKDKTTAKVDIHRRREIKDEKTEQREIFTQPKIFPTSVGP